MKINYFVLGTNDMQAAIKFYDSLFAQTELKQVLTNDRMTYWQGGEYTFALATPFNELPASNGNGTMVGFDVGSDAQVKRLHKKVLEMGGTCEGEPNQRVPYFSAYVRDLDKNKLCLYHFRG